MTREEKKQIIDIIHKTIYPFFDVCDNGEETPISDKDKLLLKVNKAICNNIKALEQEPCDDNVGIYCRECVKADYCLKYGTINCKWRVVKSDL